MPFPGDAPSGGAATRMVHIGRQPIYDRDGQVAAYELLFEGEADGIEASRRSPYATSQVIVNAFTEFGLDQIVGENTCFINLTRDFLVGDLPVPFEAGQAVLEILGGVEVDEEVVLGVERLVRLGYPVAVNDDVAIDLDNALWDMVAYVKIDVSRRVAGELDSAVAPFRRAPEITLVAERVDTPQHLEMVEQLGFELLQGQVLGQPQMMSIQSLSPSRMRRLELLAALNSAEVDLDDVVSIVTGDPGLSFRVLRATNSASVGLPRKISSVRDAVVLLGPIRIRQWVALMLLSDIAETASEDLLATTMARARLCQTVAERLDLPGDAAFTVGLLAGIASLVKEPVSEVVERLPLTEEVIEALVHGTNPLGQVLSMVRAYEAKDGSALRSASVSPADLAKAYLSAVGWSVRTVGNVLGEEPSNTRRRLPPVATTIRRS